VSPHDDQPPCTRTVQIAPLKQLVGAHRGVDRRIQLVLPYAFVDVAVLVDTLNLKALAGLMRVASIAAACRGSRAGQIQP
jgi:hypothetical protein